MDEITLSNGRRVRVLPVPPFAVAAVESRFPLPEAEDHERFRQALEARAAAVRETGWLMALPEVTVPDGWQFPDALERVGIHAREGEVGQRLDYIEYDLLRSTDDVRAVLDIMHGPIAEAEVAQAVATFQPESEEARG